MSAFIVSKTHIDTLLTLGLYGPAEGWSVAGFQLSWHDEPAPREVFSQGWHTEHTRVLSHETADRVGTMLISENLASVAYRYASASNGASHDLESEPELYLPGPADPYYYEPYIFRPTGATTYSGGLAAGVARASAVEALKAIRCYEYQSCEHPAWDESEAAQFCQALRAALLPSLPGYDDAPWEWNEEAVACAKARQLGFGH